MLKRLIIYGGLVLLCAGTFTLYTNSGAPWRVVAACENESNVVHCSFRNQSLFDEGDVQTLAGPRLDLIAERRGRMRTDYFLVLGERRVFFRHNHFDGFLSEARAATERVNAHSGVRIVLKTPHPFNLWRVLLLLVGVVIAAVVAYVRTRGN